MHYPGPLKWFICLLLLCGRVAAQSNSKTVVPPLVFRHLDNTNGLLSNQVFSIAQDKKGYIWIGTARGLQRFDGQRLKNYADTSAAVNGPLPLSALYPDEQHQRLIYMQSLKTVKQRQLLSGQAGWLNPEIEWREENSDAYTDLHQKKWRLQYYQSTTGRADAGVSEGMVLIKEEGKPKPYFAFFTKDNKQHKTWVTEFTHGLLLFDDQRKQVFGYGDTLSHEPLLSLDITDPLFIAKIKMDSHANLWVMTWSDNLYRYSTTEKKLYKYSVATIAGLNSNLPANSFAAAVLSDDHGNCWIATAYAGLLQYQYENDSFTAFTNQPGNNLSLQYNHEIYSLFQDREHNIWVGSDKGISIFNPYQQYFSAISYPADVKTEITCALQTADSGLVVGSLGGGIYVYDKQMTRTTGKSFSGIDENRIWCLLQNKAGDILAGCQHGFVHQFNAQFALIKTVHPPELENSTVRTMLPDDNGNIYYGLHNGKIVQWNKTDNTFIPFASNLCAESFVPSPVHVIHIDRQGTCRVGTENGLACFDMNTHAFSAVYRPSTQMPAVVQNIAQYNDTTLIIGMQHTGIYLFNTKRNQFSALNINTGQPFWSANTIGVDKEKNIWFTTDYAVWRYNEHTRELISFTPGGGIAGVSFLPGNFIQAAPDKWYTCTNTEIISFNPSYITRQHSNSIVITGIKVLDKPLFADSLLAAGKPVTMSYKNNFITIEFSDLQFSGVLDTKYYYRLTGIDNDWVNANIPSASYTNLPPGRYHFTVTSGSPGNAKDMAGVDIIIIPPYWETTWFRLLCVAAVCLLLYFIGAWYIRNIQREASLKTQIANTEMMALRAQMNPHFIFNCINSIDALIQCDDKYNATMYLNKFAKLIRNILDSSKQQTIGLKKDLETLELYVELERLRSNNKFSAEIKTDDAVFNKECKVPPLIIQPYVENAILHGLRNRPGNSGKLIIQVFRQEDKLVYIIEDNGIGRKAAANTNQKYRSYGMEMTRDRLKLFNQQEEIPVEITDLEEEGKATGTKVRVSLKIK